MGIGRPSRVLLLPDQIRQSMEWEGFMVCRGDAGGCRPKKGRKKRTERGELRFPTKGFGDVTVFF